MNLLCELNSTPLKSYLAGKKSLLSARARRESLSPLPSTKALNAPFSFFKRFLGESNSTWGQINMFLSVLLLNYGSYNVAAIKDHLMIIQVSQHLGSTKKTHNSISIHNGLKPVGNSNDRDIGSKLTSERSLNHCIRFIVCRRDNQTSKFSQPERQTNCGCS